MEKLLKLEIKKMLHKKDLLLISGVLVLVPFIFSFCLINSIAGINFSGLVSVDSYGIMIWSFLKYLFVLYLVPMYIACNLIGKEIENRSINIMLSNAKRMKVLTAKIITYVIYITVFFALFQLSGLISYFIFVKGSSFAAEVEASVIELLFLYLFQWFEMIFVLLITAAFSSMIKGNAALLLGMGVVILQRIFVNIDSIKRILPYYISDYSYYNMIPKDNLYSTNIVSVIIYIAIICCILMGTIYIWRKRDF